MSLNQMESGFYGLGLLLPTLFLLIVTKVLSSHPAAVSWSVWWSEGAGGCTCIRPKALTVFFKAQGG